MKYILQEQNHVNMMTASLLCAGQAHKKRSMVKGVSVVVVQLIVLYFLKAEPLEIFLVTPRMFSL